MTAMAVVMMTIMAAGLALAAFAAYRTRGRRGGHRPAADDFGSDER